MSETTQDPIVETPEAPPPVVETPEPPPVETTTETPPDQPKPRRADRHVAQLTARLNAIQQEKDAAERRATAAEALLNAGKPDPAPDATPPRASTQDVETRASQIAAEREFSRKLAEIDTAGKKDMGADAWEAAKATLTGLGATTNQAFLEALAETSNPAKIFAELADDPDELVALLSKSPAALAAKLGRLDAKMETTAAKPISSAPKPPAPIRAAVVEKEPDIYDESLSMKEWAALWDKQAPRHLGGRR